MVSGPRKTAREICEQLEACIIDAESSNVEFLNYLCDQALNLDAASVNSDKSAEELFFSPDFAQFSSIVTTWNQARNAKQERLFDML